MPLRNSTLIPCLLSLLLTLVAGETFAQTKLLRFPDIHGDTVVFSYAGDLWLAPSSGGHATRLTAHPGLELFPKFSPGGERIAFTGQYDGDEQVYVVPTAGGVPKQLTHYPARGPLAPRWGYDNQVYGWTKDGKAIVFRSMRDGFRLTDTRLYTLSVDGGLPEPLPMPVSGGGDLSPDGRRVVYTPLARDFRAWKRYAGGWAQDLYIFDLATLASERVTDHPRTDRDPMWIGDEIYFASDRDGTLNLYSYDLASLKTRQITRSSTWDIRWPSAGEQDRIVYELGGELQVLDTRTGQSRPLSIFVPNDGVAMRPARVSVEKLIEGFALSPKGKRALFVAGGDVFSAPVEKGATRNLTRSPDAHDKWARWSPNGQQIAYVSDESGEEEIYLLNQDGSGAPERLTSGGTAMRYAPEWSPDGKHVAFSDKDGKVYVLTIASKELIEVADDVRGRVRDYAWSPDGAHLAFSLSDPNGFSAIHIYSVADSKLRRVTTETFNEFEPAWHPDGQYLYYLSDREFAPQVSTLEWNFATNRTTGIFALALRKDVKHPFPPESDEVGDVDEPEKKDEEERNKATKSEARPPVKIDFDGLRERVARVPLEADNYEDLEVTKEYLLYVRSVPFYYGRDAVAKPMLETFSLKDRKQETVAEEVDGYALSRDGQKVLVKHEKTYSLYEIKAKAQESKEDVSTKGLMADRVPAEEWAQIFDEVWRRYRDFFYVPNMHGYDWQALREQYRPLLDHVAHRSDLNYLIGEMIAELNVSHTYIEGGAFDGPDRPKVALPGARLALDRASGRYRIRTIFGGHNEEERYRSPLTEIGVDVKEGDYLLAIDGKELRQNDNPYRLLRHKAERPVELTVNDEPTFAAARKVYFNPITSETDLRYLAWVARNREQVSRLTEGRVGYIHLPDMGQHGIREFIKWFYPQIRKEGLVVDVRNNGGGNVSQMLIERLRRELLGVRYSRTSDDFTTYPASVLHGHFVCLLNENSASDGDIFAAMFRQAGLGPLIGKRSWGGVIGITRRGDLVDGGTIYVPEFGTNAPSGEWVIEGHGVEPDIVVENDSRSLIAGRDPQLERAVQEIMTRIRDNPKKRPTRPTDPVRTK